MKITRFTATAVALTLGVSLLAQPQADGGSLGQRPLTLRDCMEYALENSAKIESQKADTDDARVERRDAILRVFTPSISAGSNAYSNFGRSVDPQTNTYVSTTSFSNGYSVSGRITLFDGFSAVNNMKISRISLQMGIDRETQLRDQICLATAEAFFNVVYYKKLTEIVEGQVKTLEDALTLARRQEELGQKGYSDVVQTEADLADMNYTLITTRNKFTDALITLKDMMFWDMDEELSIDYDSAETLGAAATEDRAAGVADYAAVNNPSVLIARARLENAALDLKTARWQFSPTVSLSGGWSTNYFTYPGKEGYVTVPFRQQFINNGGEYVQLSLSFPIFDRLSTFSNLRRKKNAYRKASADYETACREVRAEVERAVNDRDGALAALDQAYKREAVQEKAWDMNVRKFSGGLISPIDFRKASDSYLSAKAERLNAYFQWQLKRSVVNYYGGTPYIEQF